MMRLQPRLHLYGIPLRIHPSWLLTAAIVVAAVVTFAPRNAGELSSPPRYLGGALVAALLFCSVLIHEFAHAVAARRCGLPVRRITMHFFGGAAEVDADRLQPRAEAIVAVVGPLASGALAGLFGLLWWVERGVGGFPTFGLALLAIANAALAVLTILPGYPLDGGRIVRAGLWYLLDDLVTATRLAAAYGQALGWALLAAGLVMLLREQPLWGVALISSGWFLRNEARQGYQQILWRDLSKRVPTIHAAFLQAPRIPADRLLDEAVDDVLEGLGQGGEGGPSLVVNEAGRPIGLLGLDQVRAIKRARWTAMTAGEAMLPLAALPTLPADLPLDKALAACVAGRYSYALVIGGVATDESDGPAIGIITPARITRHLAHGIRTRRDPSEPVTEVGE
ncbi:MAG TPA: site-2 protease family protein [Thermomicrobiales bacterium]|jgi:Zn-dependent protease